MFKVEARFEHDKQEQEVKIKDFQMMQTNLEARIKELERENENLTKNLKQSRELAKGLEETISGLNKKNNVFLLIIFR